MASSQLSVSWKDHSNALSTICKTLLENNFLVDCTIAADGQRLKAHRLILSACSPYFQMLFGEESEKHPIVFLKDVSFDTLKAVIDFIYHGETQISEGHLDAFLTLAASLQIKGLNDSSKKNRKLTSSDGPGDAHCSSNDSKDVYEIQSTSVSRESNHEFALQHHDYHSDMFRDPAPSNSAPFEECSDTYGVEVKSSVLQSPHQQTPALPDDSAFDAERSAERESIHEVLLVPKQEQIDEVESDELMQDMPEEDSNTMEGTAPAFGEQHLNQFSGIAASCSESTSVLPGAFTMPQMTLPSDAQGAARALAVTRLQRLAHSLRRVRVCPHCYKSFKGASQLEMHVRTHTGERPFKCDVCGAAFAQRGHLKEHVRIHTGERPFKCDLCGAAFAQRSNLKKHGFTHRAGVPL